MHFIQYSINRTLLELQHHARRCRTYAQNIVGLNTQYKYKTKQAWLSMTANVTQLHQRTTSTGAIHTLVYCTSHSL